MSKGIVYVARSEVEGLVKIGRTQNLEKRKYDLEKTGYKCIHCYIEFAIELDNYEEKENLLHSLFGHAQASKSEFFAADKELVK